MFEVLVTKVPLLRKACCSGWEQNQRSVFCAVGEAERFVQAPLLFGGGGKQGPRLLVHVQIYVKERIHSLETNVSNSL